MKYCVVAEGLTPKAIIVHDYSDAFFTFRSVSRYLTAAISCCLSTTKGYVLYKPSENSVKTFDFNESNPTFLDHLTKKLIFSGFWNIKDSGELVSITELDDLSSNIL